MLAALGTQLAAMAPAALVAVPAVLSLGAAFAAIKIGTSGIGDAFKAAFAPAASSAHAAASATRQVENAQRSLAKAQQGVKDAEVRAAEARVQAARQISDAQRSLKSTCRTWRMPTGGPRSRSLRPSGTWRTRRGRHGRRSRT
jgi:hypothetical protein